MEELFSSLNNIPPDHHSSYPYPPRRHTFPHATPSLQVATNVDNDPSEATARPSNAHVHAQFHSLSLPVQPDRQLYGEEFTQTTSLGLSKSLSRPLLPEEVDRLGQLDRLKFFLATAPSHWSDPHSIPDATNHVVTPTNPHPSLYRFLLPNQEYVSCVLWGNLFHITGTDIVRALVFRFEAFGRPVKNMKKFEEGVFSDLRNLKPGQDATLEEPKSPFLDLLFRHQAIRTQKKQKVFYWFSVPHDRLFLDALERDLKKEKVGLEPTTKIEGEPALSFTYDRNRGLYEQFCGGNTKDLDDDGPDDGSDSADGLSTTGDMDTLPKSRPHHPQTPYSGMFTLFEGSPTYKQRRKKPARASGLNVVVNADRPRSYPNSIDGSGLDGLSAADLFRMQARGELGVKQEEATWEVLADDERRYGAKGFRCPLMTCQMAFGSSAALNAHLATHQQPRPTNSSNGGGAGPTDVPDDLMQPVTRHSTGSSVASYHSLPPNPYPSTGLGGDMGYYSGGSEYGSDYDYSDRWALGSASSSVQSFQNTTEPSSIYPDVYGTQYMSTDLNAYSNSVSAPPHQPTFDHEQLARMRLSQSPNIPPASGPLPQRPVSYHHPSYSSGSASSMLEGGGGPVRRHRSMTPSVVPTSSSSSSSSASAMALSQSLGGGLTRRPGTASSTSNGGEFALMQSQQPQQQQQQQPQRGRGYHPYAGGYVSRSGSVSGGSTSSLSNRNSPAHHAIGLPTASFPVHDPSLLEPGTEYPMYRTESPALMAYGTPSNHTHPNTTTTTGMYPMDSVDPSYPVNPRYYHRQGHQHVTL